MDAWTDCLDFADPDAVFLTEMEYQTLLIKLEDDNYVPTPAELENNYTTKKHCFFIVRRNHTNHIIYYDDINRT